MSLRRGKNHAASHFIYCADCRVDIRYDSAEYFYERRNYATILHPPTAVVQRMVSFPFPPDVRPSVVWLQPVVVVQRQGKAFAHAPLSPALRRRHEGTASACQRAATR